MRWDPTEPMAILPSYASQFVQERRAQAEASREPPKPPPMYFLASDGQTIEAAAGSAGHRQLLAVVPVSGALSPTGSYGGTSLDWISRQLSVLDADPNVSTILLHITSPGGTISGTPEAADAARAVRERGATRIVAIADGLMASAATWIGTAASEVSVTPSGEAGSIGVITIYPDTSKALEDMGVKIDVIRNPDKKARFTGFEPLTDEMRQHLEERNLRAYDQFKRAMAKNRGIRVDQVESRFGGGEMMPADEAKAAGLVDRIETFDAIVGRLMGASRRKASGSVRAAIDLAAVSAEEI